MVRNTFNDNYPIAQFALTVVVAFITLLIFFAMAMVTGKYIFGPDMVSLENLDDFSDPSMLPVIKFFQIVQTIGLFLIPAIILAGIFSGNIRNYLFLKRSIKLKQYILVIFIMVSAIPLINLLAFLNEQITFPPFMRDIEQVFKNTEKQYEKITLAFLNVNSVNALLLNIFMIGVLPAIGEELMFRGIVQRIFSNMTRNAHWGIFISSFLFSAIHFQFYGFIPRLLLGMFFGYLLFWSGSMWVPILAHFVNNTISVLIYYFVNIGKLGPNTPEIGKPTEIISASIISLLIFGYFLYLFYRNLKKEGRSIEY